MVPQSLQHSWETGPSHRLGVPPNTDISSRRAPQNLAGPSQCNPSLLLCEPTCLTVTGNTSQRHGFSQLSTAKPAKINQALTWGRLEVKNNCVVTALSLIQHPGNRCELQLQTEGAFAGRTLVFLYFSSPFYPN